MDEQIIVPTEETLLDKTRKVVAELKAENDRKEALLLEEQKIKANELLGGRSESGIQAPQKSEAELKKEQALNYFSGTGIDKAIQKYG